MSWGAGSESSCERTVTRLARKDHRCYECCETILKGDAYVYISGVWEGTPDSFRLCSACYTIGNTWLLFCRANPKLGDCCWELGSLWSNLAEWIYCEHGYDPHEPIGGKR